MNDNDKLRIGALAAASVLAPLLLAVLLEPPAWALVLLVIQAAVGLLATAARLLTALRAREDELRAVRAESFQTANPAPTQPAPEEVRLQDRITEIPVPSAEPDYRFVVSATVRWSFTNQGRFPIGDPAALVRHMVLDRICAITAKHPPGNPQLLQHVIAAELSVRRPDASGALLGWAEEILVSLAEQDAARLEKLATLRKEEHVWEHERRFEINKRDYLGKDVFKSTGSAVIWLLAQDQRRIVETVELIDTLTRLTAAANDDSVPSVPRRWLPGQAIEIREEPGHPGLWSVPEPAEPAPTAEPQAPPSLALVNEMFPETESGQRELFQDQLAELVRKHGREDIADQLRPHAGAAMPGTDAAGADRPVDAGLTTSTEPENPSTDPDPSVP